ncbi:MULTISPECIES: 4-hydroxybenzoate octaprenyltransferase [Legionella]|uniref:4-hydroxybenzoate octaprenyltransferase n=1 Tax=Legionella resiliens TaxID=2905958 RepID=A0ABS8X7K7_9GAMM|nr:MULTISPECIES: 4-hydroxybenzoate octaprenyltransferase [unclassified Legionella]MCE0723901.1 4-hydroxybenzoate octaprenyltransferase [Legionella sp. 9fVS26]MCE3533053.1 4-hydroxybenzoate octaprenyltransferase [Legionella sp. 8cVS16]QLZ69246.1 4-hydroxybenzoate octaprenyltransferase [Legionella sp. PC1000]
MKWNAYWRLMRFDKPVGILLLWFPTAWALWLANKGVPPLRLFILFLCGTVFMRAAGCVINDIADRNIDKHVARTKLRPLTSGEVSLPEAFFLLIVLLFAALFILLQLPRNCFYFGLIALFISFLYPFCKRFLDAPQLILGLAFSMGIPMAYVASDLPLNGEFFLLFLINFSWILVYDTMYAMADKADDLRIGVKSTAIYFASYDRMIIGLLQGLFHGLWLCLALENQINLWFYIFWFAAGMVLMYQQKLISKRIPQECFKAFIVSVYYGALMWLAVVGK